MTSKNKLNSYSTARPEIDRELNVDRRNRIRNLFNEYSIIRRT
jgi:hypothetical protein